MKSVKSQHKAWRCSPELEEHAALLLPLCDHLEGVQATIAAVTVPAAEGDERAVEAVVPGAVLVHVPEAVLVGSDCKIQTLVQINVMAIWSKTRLIFELCSHL